MPAFAPLSKKTAAASLLVFMGVLAQPASASIVWDWQYSASGITASGTFTTLATPQGNGGYLITAITRTRNGKTITQLQPAGTSIPGNEPYTVDNLVFRGPGPQLTSHGFGFAISGGTYSNPFYADFLPSPVYLEFFSTPGVGHTELPVAFSATPVTVPEPATGVLIFAAVGFMLCAGSRKKNC